MFISCWIVDYLYRDGHATVYYHDMTAIYRAISCYIVGALGRIVSHIVTYRGTSWYIVVHLLIWSSMNRCSLTHLLKIPAARTLCLQLHCCIPTHRERFLPGDDWLTRRISEQRFILDRLRTTMCHNVYHVVPRCTTMYRGMSQCVRHDTSQCAYDIAR